MPGERAINEFKELCQKFAVLLEKHRKRNKTDQHASYKKKRIAEATKHWAEFNKKLKEVEQKITPDQCFEDMKEKATNTYKEYMQLLVLIPAESEGSESENGDPSQAETAAKIKSQEVRFEAMKRNLNDVHSKLAANDGESVPLVYAQVKIKKITELWHRIEVEDEKLEEANDEYYNKYIQLEKDVEDVLIYLQEKLQTDSVNSEGVKLNRVTIPKFNGDYFKWVTFRDLFKTMVMDKKGMSNSQKMQILKTNLGGEAETLIGDLVTSEVNLQCAWDRLVNRFENKKVVVYKLMGKLMAQPTQRSDAKSIKKLLDTTDQTLLALQNLERPVDHWDDWIVVCISQKFTDEIQREWEKQIGGSTDLPTWENLKKFMEEQYRIMERIESSRPLERHRGAVRAYQASITNEDCPICNNEHTIFNCEKWKQMDPKDRWVTAKKKMLCFLCLKKHEDKLSCDRKRPCKKCPLKHSTWLHENRREKAKASDQVSINIAHGRLDGSRSPGLLATILVLVQNNKGRQFYLRALADSGSQASMITSKAAALLEMDMTHSTAQVKGLGGNINGKADVVNLEIQPHFKSMFTLDVGCYVLKKLTEPLPNTDLNVESWEHIKGLELADPLFNQVGAIDLLLGADAIGEIVLPEIRKGTQGTPMAQKTRLGWIIFGRYDAQYERKVIHCNVMTTQEGQEDDIDLSRFWELEELNPERQLTAAEKECEQHYKDTIKRDVDGKYIAKIPFKKDLGPEKLGFSRGQCMARFLQLEKRLTANAELKQEYTRVMNEYIQLDHMRDVTNESKNQKLYYIPHHAVIKPDSLTTKTRVVFDASAKTSSGLSLNECMHVGAKQQQDLMDIVIRWRKHSIVFKADIEKMYRQIKLDPDDQRFHTILWRDDPSKEIKEYQLKTVTFGTAAAPFMATRTLNQIALDTKDKFPLAADIIQQDFYVDDLISGGNSLLEATQKKDELVQALQTGSLNLRKWTSNSQELLATLPKDMTEKSLQLFEDDETKALGIRWNPRTDEFSFRVNWEIGQPTLTKRQLLSESSKLYDPLGWLAPVMIKAKILIQQTWLQKIGWDEGLTEQIKNDWQVFKQELPTVANLRIPRWLKIGPETEITLHGFCDASEVGYAAVVYLRTKIEEQVVVTLVASRTRVAPIRTKTTLPKLELCGAVLLSSLMTTIVKALQLPPTETFAWSDSMITLGWIKAGPENWKTFVANRVAEINGAKIDHWQHVRSEENPADSASRGVMPSELQEHPLWFTGPVWLKEDPSKWPNTEIETPEAEQKTVAVNVAIVIQNDTINRISSWDKLLRVTAYCRRFKTKKKGNLTMGEITEAKMGIIKRCQEESFAQEIANLKAKQPISRKSKLVSLDPFLDNNGILRVGGRLIKATLPFAEKHPIIVPNDHTVARLLTQQMHKMTLHGGPQLMINLLRKRYWILQGKRTAKGVYNSCVTCRRFKGQTHQQMMGNLPEPRITPGRSFLHSGVDYAGPIQVKTSSLRSAKTQDGYIAIFVCMTTKAVHLELVSSQSTVAFLAAFDRFTSRRGLPQVMYSDNGRNFLGGANKLERDLFKIRNEQVAERAICNEVRWEFIPPATPHFGGLWERGVRSMKEHLKKTLKTASLTFEEYGTVLSRIEACMNSRPLCPINEDVESLDALTPGHFLIGNALLAPPTPDKVDYMITRNRRWEYVQLLQKQIWDRWSNEYLTTLQQRHKWQQSTPNVMVGDLVAVKEDNMPPQKWLLGRVMETHGGSDGRVRVATMKVMSGNPPKPTLTQRPVVKLCPLVTQMDEIQEKTLTQLKDTSNAEPMHEAPKGKGKTPKFAKGQHKYNLRTKSKSKINPGMMVLGILTLTMLFGGGLAKQAAIEITPFSNKAGIYFENLGRASLTRSHWNLVVYFDLKNYFVEIKTITESMKKLKDACINIPGATEEVHCSRITELIHERLDTIRIMNWLLQTNKLHKHRIKRGAFDGVGWLGNKLFGIMDAEHATALEKDIEECRVNDNHLLELIKKQTSTMELTANLIKTVHEDSMKNFAKVSTAIETLANLTDVNRRHSQLVSWAIYATLQVDRVEKIQHNIIHMLTGLQQGHVSSYLFTPTQLREQLATINDHLPMGTKLPADPQHDMKSFYEVMRGLVRVTEKFVLIEINIPLVSTFDFQVFHLVPVPTRHLKKRVAIRVESEYLLMTLQKDVFYQMDHKEFEKCIRPPSGMIICDGNKPWYTAQSVRSICERELLARTTMTTLSPTCKLDISANEDFWHELQEDNKWIFDLEKEVTLNIVCGTEVDTQLIQGAGVMEIQPGCEASHNGVIIMSKSKLQTKGVMDFQPSMNLSKLIEKSSIELDSLEFTNHTKHFDQIYSNLDKITKESELMHKHKHVAYLSYTSTIVLILAVILVAGWKVRNNWKTRCTQQNQQPTVGDVANTRKPQNDSDDVVNSVVSNCDGEVTSSTVSSPRAGGCPFRT